MSGDLGPQILQLLVPGPHEDICIVRPFYRCKGYEYDFGVRYLCGFQQMDRLRYWPAQEHTLARVVKSCISGVAACSSVSSTSVRGLALSLRLSSFCSSSRLCDRL